MSRKSSTIVVAFVLLVVAALALGGVRWLWHFILRMHGVR